MCREVPVDTVSLRGADRLWIAFGNLYLVTRKLILNLENLILSFRNCSSRCTRSLSFYYAMKLDEINADFNYQDGNLQIVRYVPSYWLSWQ